MPNAREPEVRAARPVAIDLDTSPRDAHRLDSERAEQEIFLTPRVVDQGAFEQFSGDLRQLIQDAANAGRALVRTGSDTDRHLASMRDAAGELRKQIETGARLIPTIDQRLARIEAALTKATERAELEAKIAQQIDEIVQEKIHAATERAAAVGTRLGEALAKAQELSHSITGRIDAAVERVEKTATRIEGLEATLAERLTKAEALAERMGPAVDDAEQRIGAALTEAEVSGQSLGKVLAELTPQVEAARALVKDAQAAANDPVLAEAVKAGEGVKRTLLRAVREAKTIIEQADLARERLAEDVEGVTAHFGAAVPKRDDSPTAADATTPAPAKPEPSPEGEAESVRFRRTDR